MHAIGINYDTIRYPMGLIATVPIIVHLVLIVSFHPFNHRPSKLGLLLRCCVHLIRTSAWLLSENDVFCLGKVPFMIAIEVGHIGARLRRVPQSWEWNPSVNGDEK
jgi:hypothetical protein